VSFSKFQTRALPKLAEQCDFSVAGSARKGVSARSRVRTPLSRSMRGIFPRLSFSMPCARRSGSREHSPPPVAISGLNLLDQGFAGLLRDEGAVKIPGWLGDLRGVHGFSGDAYGRERSGRSRCIDLRERQERTQNRDRNRPVLQHPKIANSTTRLPAGAVERARPGVAIAKQTPPFTLGERPHSLALAGAKSTPIRALDATPKSMNRSSAFSTLLSASREPVAANAAVMMEGISEEP
jgi:hypothetical protein